MSVKFRGLSFLFFCAVESSSRLGQKRESGWARVGRKEQRKETKEDRLAMDETKGGWAGSDDSFAGLGKEYQES